MDREGHGHREPRHAGRERRRRASATDGGLRQLRVAVSDVPTVYDQSQATMDPAPTSAALVRTLSVAPRFSVQVSDSVGPARRRSAVATVGRVIERDCGCRRAALATVAVMVPPSDHI